MYVLYENVKYFASTIPEQMWKYCCTVPWSESTSLSFRLSVCVCLSRRCIVQKRLNTSRLRLVWKVGSYDEENEMILQISKILNVEFANFCEF